MLFHHRQQSPERRKGATSILCSFWTSPCSFIRAVTVRHPSIHRLGNDTHRDTITWEWGDVTKLYKCSMKQLTDWKSRATWSESSSMCNGCSNVLISVTGLTAPKRCLFSLLSKKNYKNKNPQTFLVFIYQFKLDVVKQYYCHWDFLTAKWDIYTSQMQSITEAKTQKCISQTTKTITIHNKRWSTQKVACQCYYVSKFVKL